MVNGNTWPFQTVEKRRYRFRFLNGCQARFLILDFANIPGVEVWQIGNEGGFLAAPVNITARPATGSSWASPSGPTSSSTSRTCPSAARPRQRGPRRAVRRRGPRRRLPRADAGQHRPGHAVPGGPAVALDPTTPPRFLQLPAIAPLPAATTTRPLALIGEMSEYFEDGSGGGRCSARGGRHERADAAWTMRCGPTPSPRTLPSAPPRSGSSTTSLRMPTHARPRGRRSRSSTGRPSSQRGWRDLPRRSSPAMPRPPEPWETGSRTRSSPIRARSPALRLKFATPGQFVWHCHIVEHEDNEMMRPFRIGPEQPGQPGQDM